jgi:hypothetical protein
VGLIFFLTVMGEITVERIGDSMGDPSRREGLSLNELFNERVTFGVTRKEYEETDEF